MNMEEFYKNLEWKDSKNARPDREVLETDMCDWCKREKATITDKTYVYCSVECQKAFEDNASKAIEAAIRLLSQY